MTSKERVRAAYQRQPVDRVPAAFEAVSNVREKLLKHYGFTSHDQLVEKYDIDIIYADARYIGPKLKEYTNAKGEPVKESFWGFEMTYHATGVDVYGTASYFPLKGVETLEELAKYTFPDPDWFDYTPVREACEKYPDKAITIGHPGPFQMVTNLMEMDEFFMLMYDEPEVTKAILDGMVNFELEYYKRCFEAGGGKVDVLRPHDDYGTQISMLFSMDMWRDYFKENTKKLVELTHSYGAFYQQHSCGAVAPIIPELIECGVDALEPIQKVKGLEVDGLAAQYGGKITFHGGIDTQGLLPNGTPEEVIAETEKFIRTLGKDHGYILMASQSFEPDVPIENIEAVYRADRTV